MPGPPIVKKLIIEKSVDFFRKIRIIISVKGIKNVSQNDGEYVSLLNKKPRKKKFKIPLTNTSQCAILIMSERGKQNLKDEKKIKKVLKKC